MSFSLLAARELSRHFSAPSSWGGVSRRVAKRRRRQKRRNVSIKLLTLICLIPLAACGVAVSEFASVFGAGASGVGAYFDYKSAEKGEPIIVAPALVDYSPTVQTQAADELESLPPPCARDVIVGDCSVAARMILDYATLRDKIRAATDKD